VRVFYRVLHCAKLAHRGTESRFSFSVTPEQSYAETLDFCSVRGREFILNIAPTSARIAVSWNQRYAPPTPIHLELTALATHRRRPAASPAPPSPSMPSVFLEIKGSMPTVS